jgi:hypothetical protein
VQANELGAQLGERIDNFEEVLQTHRNIHRGS